MTPPPTAPGRLVAGRYRLQSQIGGGGMGAVWLALDELLGRQVAVKQVLAAAGTTPGDADQQRERALREGRIAARLSHPHAISVYDVALEAGQPWLIMEYLPSRSLAVVLAEDGPLREDQVAQIGAQVADALAATHAAGIVHRDVKPANVLIGEGGRIEGLVKITDFGISHASGDVTLTQTGQITGTPAFLAPEVAQGHPMTGASDVFSLGATLYTCLEGTPPFGMEENALAMLHKVAGGQIVPPRRAGALQRPMERMLAADPAQRPSMVEVRDELATLAAGRDGDTTTILMARTDLGSGTAERTRTTTFPAVAAAPGTPQPVAPARSATPPPAPPRPVVAQQRRRRGRALWLAAALVVLVLAGLAAAWALDLTGDDGSFTAQESSPATSPATSPPTQQETQEPTEPTPTDETTASRSEDDHEGDGGDDGADGESVRARDVQRAVREFFEPLPDDPEAAYELTSPDFQAEFDLAGFEEFWGQFDRVRLRDVEAEDGSTAAAVRIEYRWADSGERQTERHDMTFAIGDDGELLLDTDEYRGQAD
jgi:serine/threonine protein kinase